MSRRLLSIDVEEELSKLALGRLRNLSQAPVALARLAASAGASHLRIIVERRRLRVEHDGDVPDAPTLSSLRALLDRDEDSMLRHAALEELESKGMLDLLVAFALGAERVDLDMAAPVSRRLVVAEGGSRVEFMPTTLKRGVVITIWGGRHTPVAERAELVDALKHARFQVVVDGRRVDRGPHLVDMLVQTSIERGSFQGVIGLPRQGLAGITRTLVNGVLEREIWESPSNGAVWEAVIDGPKALEPENTTLLQDAIEELYSRMRQHYEKMDSNDRQRIKQLLFRLADHGAGRAAIGSARLFSTVEGERVGVEALLQAALGRVVRAIGEGARRERYDLSRTVFVLDEQDRGFVERHLHLVVREPPRRPEARKWRDFFSRWAEGLKRMVRVVPRILIRAREVPAEDLIDAERRFLGALERILDAGLVWDGDVSAVAFVRGRLVGWRKTGDEGHETRLLLSRKHPKVRAMVAAFEKDPKSLYASCMLLADGERAFGSRSEEVLQVILQSAGLSSQA
jgi:hypothetical protein